MTTPLPARTLVSSIPIQFGRGHSVGFRHIWRCQVFEQIRDFSAADTHFNVSSAQPSIHAHLDL
jgi:hypothetical protein